MNPPGHLAVAYLTGRRRSLARWLPLVLGTVTPDVIDKTAQLIGVTPYGRTVGHSVLLWGWIAVAALIARGRGLGRGGWLVAFWLGGALHLMTDLVDDVVEGFSHSGWAFSAWMGWPWTNPDMWNLRVPHALGPWPGATTVLELLTVGACVIASYRDRR